MRRSEVGAGQPAASAARGRTSRADRVLQAFCQLASRELICETTGRIAVVAGVSTDTVRRAIAELITAGLLERTGLRAGKAVQYRLLDGSPQPDVESPHESAPAAPIGAGGPLRGFPPAPQTERRNDFAADEDPDAKLVARDSRHKRPAGSPMSAEDRAWMDSAWSEDCFEWSQYRTAAQWMQAAGVRISADVDALEQSGCGACADCKQEAESRSRFGRLELCRPCVGRRQAVALKLASDIARAMPNERELPTRPVPVVDVVGTA